MMNVEGKRRPMKMADIAKLAGVNTSTVSRALAGHPAIPEATRDTILRIAREQGYSVNRSARSLRQSQTQTIGVAIPLGHEAQQMVSDPFFLHLIGHLADEISKRNYDVLLHREPSPDAGWLERLIQSRRADGYLILGQSYQHEALNVASQYFRPLVVWGAQLPDQNYCSVGSDNVDGGKLAVKHLLRSGRDRVVFLGPTDVPEGALRLAGYREALQDAGVRVDDQLILPAHFTGESAGEALGEALAGNIRFDAIFAASDGIALSAIRALEGHSLSCPRDVMVVGFDDLEAARYSKPALTTVKQDLAAGASTMVEYLFRRLAGEETPSATLPVELIVRDSAPHLHSI